MIDYSAAQELADVVRAFAIVESGEGGVFIDEQSDAFAPLGDGGRAVGLLQMHPATFKRYYGCVVGRFEPSTDDTWTTSQIKACAAYLYCHKWGGASKEMRDLVVQGWNLGESAVFLKHKRNPEYLRRWHEAYAKITEGE